MLMLMNSCERHKSLSLQVMNSITEGTRMFQILELAYCTFDIVMNGPSLGIGSYLNTGVDTVEDEHGNMYCYNIKQLVDSHCRKI